MKKLFTAMTLSLGLAIGPVLAQEKGEAPTKGQMPMKEGMPMKSEGMQGGMTMGNMNEMHKKMSGMKKTWTAWPRDRE